MASRKRTAERQQQKAARRARRAGVSSTPARLMPPVFAGSRHELDVQPIGCAPRCRCGGAMVEIEGPTASLAEQFDPMIASYVEQAIARNPPVVGGLVAVLEHGSIVEWTDTRGERRRLVLHTPQRRAVG